MKNYISIALFSTLVFTTARASEVTYYNGNWENIKAKAKAEHKYIFMDCYTYWCGWCKVMDKETMPDPAIVSLLSEKFVPVKIEMEHDEGMKIAMKYHVSGFPTFMFFNPDGELVYVSVGYQKKDAFLAELNNALDKSKQFKAPGFSANLDVDFPELYKLAFAESGKKKFPQAQDVATFLDGQKDLFSEVSWGVMLRFDGGEKYDNFFFENFKKYESLYGSNDVREKIDRILDTRLRKATKNKDKAALAAILEMTDKYVKNNPADVKLNIRMSFYRETEDWNGYTDALDEYISKHGTEDADQINDICWNLYEKCDDKNLLAKACTYMSKAVSAEPKYPNMDTYAALLYKTGQMGEAEHWATTAIETGKKSGTDVSSTEALLKKIKEKK